MGSGEIPIELGDSWFSRNSFRASLEVKSHGGRALFGLGALLGVTGIEINSECHVLILGSQTASDKIRSRKGNSPDHQLRSPNIC